MEGKDINMRITEWKNNIKIFFWTNFVILALIPIFIMYHFTLTQLNGFQIILCMSLGMGAGMLLGFSFKGFLSFEQWCKYKKTDFMERFYSNGKEMAKFVIVWIIIIIAIHVVSYYTRDLGMYDPNVFFIGSMLVGFACINLYFIKGELSCVEKLKSVTIDH